MQRLYAQLRSRAAAHLRAERRGHTLHPTALVHEAYLRLCASSAFQEFASQTQFLAVASRTFRRVLVDHARRRKARKRSGTPGLRVAVWEVDANSASGDERRPTAPIDLLVLDEALVGLDAIDERAGRIVELKFFGGMTHEQIAGLLGVSRSTVEEDWRFARAWLGQKLSS
jgi:RNA polymerase sigma factor (TIGR02999 family)